MDNPILTLHPQPDVSWLCEQNFKSKEKVSKITSLGFKTLKKYAEENGQLLKKVHLVFKILISFFTKTIQLQLNQ